MKKALVFQPLLISLLLLISVGVQAQGRGPNDGNDPVEMTVPVFTTQNQGKSVYFQIQGQDPGSGVRFMFDFGDGSVLQTQVANITHTYDSYGTYQVTVVAVADNQSLSYTRLVEVQPSQQGPKGTKTLFVR
ncbi:MAG: PKD domain-containing protein [Bacteroidia bacterium]|nr:PKD domain-containing protein [Bacteroidia bacterium]